MTEEKPRDEDWVIAKVEPRKPFITFSFNEEGNFDRYAGIYYHHPLEKPPEPEEIMLLVATIKTFAQQWAEFKTHPEFAAPLPQQGAPEPPQPPQAVRDDAAPQQPVQAPTETPRCPKKGVWLSEWTARDGRHFNARLDRGRAHKDAQYWDDGNLHCPTAVGVDEEGKTIWCKWGAAQNDDGTWRTWEAPEVAEPVREGG